MKNVVVYLMAHFHGFITTIRLIPCGICHAQHYYLYTYIDVNQVLRRVEISMSSALGEDVMKWVGFFLRFLESEC